MKVLQIINSLGTGGAEKLVTQLIPALRKLNVTTDLLVIDKHHSIFHDQLQSAQVVNTKTLGLNKFYNPLAVPRLLPHIRGYDVIHSHLFPTQYWTVIGATLRRSKIPLVTTEHNTTNRRRSVRFFQWSDRYIYRRYHTIITVSPIAEAYLSDYLRNEPTKVITIPNAIDLAPFNNVKPLDIKKLCSANATDKIVVQVSSFSEQKDHDTLLRAIALCPDAIRLALVGAGVRESAILQLIAELNIADRVTFLGLRADIPELLVAADVAVMSSHYEGLSLSVLEAFASGTAFIGTDVPGLGDISKAGGFSVKHQDPNDLAHHIMQLADNDELRKQTGNRGRNLVQEYSIDTMAKRYLDVYKNVIS